MEEVDLNEIFKIFWKKKVEVLFILLIFFIVGCIYTLKFVTPKYTSSITMILVSSSSDDEHSSAMTTTDISLNSKLISTYNKLIKSKTVLKQVISNLDIDISEEELKNSISVGSNNNNTGLIEIKVENENNELAAKIANELGNVFKDKVKELYNINNIKIMSEASVETEPSNINHKKDVAIFVLIGAVISVIYVMVLNMLDTTIEEGEAIEEEFGLPVLVYIPILRRAN